MKRIYLTVDDGPSERCSELLDFLIENKIGAALFCRGNCLRERSETAIKAIRAGFIIGNHSLTHTDFDKLSESEAREQVTKTDEIINGIYREACIERPARWFRFPYGHDGKTAGQKQAFQEILGELGYSAPLHIPDKNWGWDCDVEDWHVDENNVHAKLKAAKEKLRALPSGGVLDLHDQEPNLRLRLFQSICEAAADLGFAFYSNDFLHALARALKR